MNNRPVNSNATLLQLLVIFIALLVGLSIYARFQGRSSVDEVSERIQPTTEMTPKQVVETQIYSLADDLETGPQVAYGFSTPKHQAAVGSPFGYKTVLESPKFRPLWAARSIEYFETEISNGHAKQMVAVTDLDGTTRYYLFELEQATSGELKGCWLTDDIVRSDFYLPSESDGLSISN